jgi:DNA-binding NarL/FixJ family response regulator
MVVLGLILCDHPHMRPTALVVDDHAAFRASARTLLEDEGFEVVGEAEDGRSGLELARALDPDLVLLDVALPDLSGFDVAARLAGGHSKVVLVSSRDPRDFGARFRRTSARGFIPKENLSGETLNELLRDSS